MKKLLSVLLVLILCFSLAACNRNEQTSKSDKDSNSDSASTSEAKVSYEKAFEIFKEIFIDNDLTNLKNSLPSYWWNQNAKAQGLSVDDYFDKAKASVEKQLAEEADYKTYKSITIENKENYNESDVAKIAEFIQEEYNIPKAKVTNAIKTSIAGNIDKKGTTETMALECCFVEIDDNWYICYWQEWTDPDGSKEFESEFLIEDYIFVGK